MIIYSYPGAKTVKYEERKRNEKKKVWWPYEKMTDVLAAFQSELYTFLDERSVSRGRAVEEDKGCVCYIIDGVSSIFFLTCSSSAVLESTEKMVTSAPSLWDMIKTEAQVKHERI